MKQAIPDKTTRKDMLAAVPAWSNIEEQFEDHPDGIVVCDTAGIVCAANPLAQEFFGSRHESLVGRKLEIPIKALECVEYESGTRTLEIRAASTQCEGRDALILAIRDVSARKKKETALIESEERYALAVQGSNDGLWDWDLKKNEVFYSERWKSILGCDQHEIGASPDEWFKRIHPEDITSVKAVLSAHIEGSTPTLECEHRVLHKDGTYRWLLCRGIAVFDRTGSVCRLTGSQTDITERKEAEQKLAAALNDLKFALASEKVLLDELDKKNKELIELSITDGLTGLYNHRFIQERFEFEFKRVKRYGGNLSCMMIDIDHFKDLNDTHGHQCGDHVLRELSTLFRKHSREVDICGRYGGEEFLILTNVSLEFTMQFATKLHAAIEEHPFSFDGTAFHVTVSIGVADFRPGMKDRHELIEHSDIALYQAKEDGRNLIRIWKEKMGEDEDAVDHFSAQELKKKFVLLSDQMRGTYMEYTNALVKAVDAKDPFTREHSQNVSACAVEIGRAMGLSDGDVEIVKYAGLLHDVGKIAVNQDILVKKEPLTREEFDLLKKHPVIGVNILKDIRFLEKEIPIILHHHERFDGKGYPHGLKGREIPLGARIVAVADAFDAMTSGRGYKDKVPFESVLAELRRGSGSQFAPEVIDVFVELLEKKQPEIPV
jgi:diguanylate cyclase (GGDEF)-like protein/PAS domain S-box-containing protein/putative nucleotidyltransferase with HDIG domain